MFRSFTIKNFRCFRDLSIEPLERVNLIAGMNNVGKTALLEAMFLHIGPNNPELPMRINVFRGIQRFDAEEMWGWLFFDKHVDEVIEVISQNEAGANRSLRIQMVESEGFRPAPSRDNDKVTESPAGFLTGSLSGSLTTATGLHELMLKYQDETGPASTSRAFMAADEIRFERAKLKPFPLGVFLNTRARFPHEDAQRFSKLEAVGRQDEVLTTMQLLEPRLRRLAVLDTGGGPMIYGDVGAGQLVPLPLMGEGLVRLLSIVLAIANAPRGTILVDEIENGLHHSVMVKVWEAIANIARRSGAQVFATTHSWECICAAHQAFEASEMYDFRLHRLDRIKDDIRVVTYDQKKLTTAIATGLEVR
ncbi:MAG: hypothetical protein A3F84_04490 [Candidatus Handelsmanbacteria bacterium RIFCSPLOWO2_12_FULL_64_10]|uniref:ATPase AAA-type core domain-containing protein n=1 Tax=Handelsmanbacteria sp. (strain RIFCSPLOWO2_12_FULL_64_10) TaxID=1817868 RepID=A0A1F6D1R7_HANXR|nr:MAG: hypothetical protein A3F84_04490 [Candidatus Handelsmanbacteria bacterium RIFCSPLOWO2_12_FULL_64_10]